MGTDAVKATAGQTAFRIAMLSVGFLFLYAPIALLIVYSFNASRLVTVWAGFSTRWYAALLRDGEMRQSALISLEVALTSASLATLLGFLAALALARFGRFRTREIFAALLYAPVVLPDVIIGLALLLFFVSLNIPRGFATIVAGHTTLAMGFVAILIRAKLLSLDPTLEDAAIDLGAAPFAAFMRITLPLALPSVLAGFMLAMTLSLDDLVIASFTAGPGSTTLPMRIYSAVRLGVTPEVNAISTLVIASVGAALVVVALATSNKRPFTHNRDGVAAEPAME